jgi:hypothetical protein
VAIAHSAPAEAVFGRNGECKVSVSDRIWFRNGGYRIRLMVRPIPATSGIRRKIAIVFVGKCPRRINQKFTANQFIQIFCKFSAICADRSNA